MKHSVTTIHSLKDRLKGVGLDIEIKDGVVNGVKVERDMHYGSSLASQWNDWFLGSGIEVLESLQFLIQESLVEIEKINAETRR